MKQIRRNSESGRWLRGARGVYAVAGAPATPEQRAIVACLQGPDGTVASHLTAAALFGLVPAPETPHVTVPGRASGRFRGAVVHHTRRPLERSEICRARSVPCTTPARTLVDCAEVLGYDALRDLIDTALGRGLTKPLAVLRAAERASRAPGRKGVGEVHEMLEVWMSGSPRRSPGEMRLLRQIERWGLPVPECQHVIRDHEGRFVARVDLAAVARKVVLDYDGEEHHGPRQREADERRQVRIEALGWHVERVRKRDLRPPATKLRRRLEALLGPAVVSAA